MTFKERIEVTNIHATGIPAICVIGLLFFAVIDIILRCFGI